MWNILKFKMNALSKYLSKISNFIFSDIAAAVL